MTRRREEGWAHLDEVEVRGGLVAMASWVE